MKKAILFSLIFMYSSSLGLYSLQIESLQSPSGVVVEIVSRAYQPGEVIMISIPENSSVKRAQIRFSEKKYIMRESQTGSGLLAFIGLDLGLKPGLYTMEIFIEKTLGVQERLEKEISVLTKKFPVKKLWVKEEFVTPPPEARVRIQREAEILKVIYGMATPRWRGEGRFILPSAGKVEPNFGEKRIFNNKPRSSHGGVDISGIQGSPVRASNSGKVVLASNLYFAGKTVIIDHGLGVFTLYCHFSNIKVKRGDLVKKGEVIGEIGATGRVTGPHLHWGVKVFGSRVDPFSLLNFALK